MTTEQQLLFDMARSHVRLAGERLNETNLPFALSHLKEATRALELMQNTAATYAVESKSLTIEVTATKQPESGSPL